MKRWGQLWPRQEFVRAFTADVGSLVKLTMAKDGLRDIEKIDEKLAHEIADCLHSIFIISEKFDVNLEEAFMRTMDELEERAKEDELAKSHS